MVSLRPDSNPNPNPKSDPDPNPKAMVIGILANGEVMSMALVVGVFLANFPEAIIMRKTRIKPVSTRNNPS